MPVQGQGFEFHLNRIRTERRASDGKVRTVGQYVIYHDGVGQPLRGMAVETRGPGDNAHRGNNRRVEAGRYPLFTQDGEHYVTIGYKVATSARTIPKPGLLLGSTDRRVGILIHPGVGFLSSVGCINPTRQLSGPTRLMDFVESRDRVIAIINDLKAYSGAAFPRSNGKRIPNASIVIDGEP